MPLNEIDGTRAFATLDTNPAARWHTRNARTPGVGDDPMLAVSRLQHQFFDPYIVPRFNFGRDDHIFVVGSCFARELETGLLEKGFHVDSRTSDFDSFEPGFVTKHNNFHFINMYNPRSILAQLKLALDPSTSFSADTLITLDNDRCFDPYSTPSLALADRASTVLRRQVLDTALARIRHCRIVILTLGMAQVWHDAHTGVDLNFTPLPEMIRKKPGRFSCRILDYNENLAALEGIYQLLSEQGHPTIEIVVNVGPATLRATFTDQDIVQANTYSKSVLRAAAEAWTTRHANVHYFPAYEMVQHSNPHVAWTPDRSHVAREMVNHVVDVFLRHHCPEYARTETHGASSNAGPTKPPIQDKTGDQALLAREEALIKEIVRLKWQAWGARFPNVYIFGAGRHTQWLLPIIKDLPAPRIVAVMDDLFPQIAEISGIRIIPPESAATDEADAVVLSTDTVAELMADRTRTLLPGLPILNLYEGLPTGPYPKNIVPATSGTETVTHGMYIDPVGYCNLRCAMCPRGKLGKARRKPRGLMDVSLFKRIIDKAIREEAPLEFIGFGNWGEPLLHPQLPEMIRYIREVFAVPPRVMVISNLNHLEDPRALVEAGPDRIYISLSGMTQDVYARNHIGGDLARVLGNIMALVKARNELGRTTPELAVRFHCYRYNRADEKQARLFCKEQGLSFIPVHPYICTVEECVRFHREHNPEHYDLYIDLAKEESLMHTMHEGRCNLIDKIAVNSDGTLDRCCGVFDDSLAMGSIFDHDLTKIPHIKSDICNLCARTPIRFRRGIAHDATETAPAPTTQPGTEP